MMLFIATLLSAVVAVNAIDAQSAMGQHLMQQARRLDQNAEYSDVWISGYSIKFQGCHNIKQWNHNAEGEEDIKISTEALIRFRLCPTDSCSATSAAGCKNGYGDYVIDMDSFLSSYYQAYLTNLESTCATFVANSCSCGDDNIDEVLRLMRKYCLKT